MIDVTIGKQRALSPRGYADVMRIEALEQLARARAFLRTAPHNAAGFSGQATTNQVVPFGSAIRPTLTLSSWIASHGGQIQATVGTPGIAWSPDSQFVAIVCGLTPFIQVFQLNSQGQIIARVANPASLPASIPNGVRWSPSGNDIAVGLSTSPWINVWAWTTAGFGAKAANPGTLPAADVYGFQWDPSGVDIIVAGATSPFVNAYPWAAHAFGTKYADPAVLPLYQPSGEVLFFPASASTDVIIAGGVTAFIEAWIYTPGTGWGAHRNNPTAAAAMPRGLYLCADGRTVLVVSAGGLQTYNYVATAAAWTGPVGLSSGTQPTAVNHGCVYDPNMSMIAVIDAAAGGFRFYQIGPSTATAARLTGGGNVYLPGFPGIPSDSNASVVLSPNGQWVALLLNTAPYVQILSWFAQHL